MSREKQIEEMAKELTAYEKKLCERLPKDKCLLTSAVHAQVSCDYCKIAEFLVNAGYRKQSEGEWMKPQFFARSGFYTKKEFPCNQCGETFEVVKGSKLMHYCPNCGAKMKGV